jgi:Trypsin-co-occurring domain 2
MTGTPFRFSSSGSGERLLLLLRVGTAASRVGERVRTRRAVAVADGLGLVDLSSALEALRAELEDAWAAGQGQRVRFRVSEVTLTVQAVARREKEGGGKLRWWVVEAGGQAKTSSDVTQALVLALTPNLYDDAGRARPLEVGGEQSSPGG